MGVRAVDHFSAQPHFGRHRPGYPSCNQRRQEEGWTQLAVPQHAGGDEVDRRLPHPAAEQQRPLRFSTAARIAVICPSRNSASGRPVSAAGDQALLLRSDLAHWQ